MAGNAARRAPVSARRVFVHSDRSMIATIAVLTRRQTALALLAVAAIMLFTGCRSPSYSSLSDHLPPLDDGFHWEVFDDVLVAIPCPDGWHRAVTKGEGRYTGSLSVEDFEKEGLFKTGFTVQVVAAVSEQTGMPASIVAVDIGQGIIDDPDNEVLAVDAMKQRGNVRSCFVRFRSSPALGDKITVHTFFMAFDSADLLCMYTFESPTETWDEAFERYGIPMMERIATIRKVE